jgi:hypothetical protein
MSNFDPDVILLLVGLGIVCSTVVAIVSLVLKRRRTPDAALPADLQAIKDQLSRLEQAVDSIALETERISEGQRFTTRILSESGRPALPLDPGRRPTS